jgi:L-ascorbate metabolism protein UlaG (beta-lactamase superfamily)
MTSPRIASPALAGLAFFVGVGLSIAACKSPPDDAQPPPPPVLGSAAPASSKIAKSLPMTLAATDTFQTSNGPLLVMPIHHAAVAFRWENKVIYVDPVTPLDPLPKADIILITHAHPDHLDEATLTKIKTDKTIVIGPQAVADKTHVDMIMKNGDAKNVSGIEVEAIAMYNLVRGPTPTTKFHEQGVGNGYVLTFGDKPGDPRIYLSGDTECTPEMKALKNIDAAFLCMNLPYTMTSDEAATCALAFKPKVVFPYHFQGKDGGTQDPQAFKNAVAKDTGIEVRVRSWY